MLTKIAKRDLRDRWVRAAVVSSSVGCADELLAELLRHTTPSDDRSLLTTQLIATALADDVRHGAKRLLATIVPAAHDAPIEVWQLAAVGDLAEGLANRRKSLAAIVKDDQEQQATIRRLLTKARSLADDTNAAIPDRVAAVRLLGRGMEDKKADFERLRELLSARVPPAVQSAAIGTLARLNQSQTLIDALPPLTPKLRSEIQNLLLTNRAGAGQLLTAIESKKLEASDLDAAVNSSLLTYPSRDIRERAEKVLAAVSEDRQKVIARFRDALELTGDAARGKEFFTKNCAACHRHQNVGNDVGPKLSALKNKSPEFLLTAVLDPNRAVESKFKSFTIFTTQGQVQAGMILEESATAITLARPDGKRTTVLRRDIQSMKNGKSFMPEGLEKDASPQQLADLFQFLREN